ncbi:hypothetical protein FMM80_08190 [Schaedlerella arabinosiphila]|uniref:Uncharacterized protein n=1 Tax=Schaedlerella arabinosiphila TaxID=2044587 RepID=A0A9X5C6G4_9FIRM|nr:hypothetical protein [Schaedlerella arabinosiphila]KAI4441712.1 hypothetical protein C824_004221 [Schaedlerella arabinosiphila]NDO68657.1 hypothetical protein [Schaedlerella arabinosiphila]
MIRVYNGDAYGVQEEEYDRNQSLQFFLNGHKNEYILIYRGDRLLKVLSYYDVLYRREVPEKVLYLNRDLFQEARELFFSYEKADDRWNRAVAVCSGPDDAGCPGDVECILYYQQNLTSFIYQASEFEDYTFDEGLDLELLSRADTYIFEEFEEYTAFICDVLERKFPEKKKIFLDENADVFSCFHFHYCIGSRDTLFQNMDDVLHDSPDGKSHQMMDGQGKGPGQNAVYITSEREKDFFGRRFQKNIYSSLDIMTALFWQKKETGFGDLHPDKKFLLIRFPVYSSGLGDVIRFCMTKAAAVEFRKLDYIPVIDLSVPDGGNSFSGGREENIWEDFFEPLNEYRPEEVLQSRHVLLCSDKMDAFNPYMMEQYHNSGHMRTIYKKYLRLNEEMKAYIDPIRKRFFGNSEEHVLGVVARGTDYRYGGFDVPKPMEDTAYIELVQEKMEEWGCTSLLLATEDADIFEKFRQAGFGDRLKYLDQERFQYTDVNKKGLLVAKMKKADNDYHDEMPYLAVLYLLAECSALISNCRCGAFEVADFVNGGRYEHRYCCGEGEVE